MRLASFFDATSCGTLFLWRMKQATLLQGMKWKWNYVVNGSTIAPWLYLDKNCVVYDLEFQACLVYKHDLYLTQCCQNIRALPLFNDVHSSMMRMFNSHQLEPSTSASSTTATQMISIATFIIIITIRSCSSTNITIISRNSTNTTIRSCSSRYVLNTAVKQFVCSSWTCTCILYGLITKRTY